MRSTGAEDVAAAGEAHADFAVSDKPMPRTRVPITEESSAAENIITHATPSHPDAPRDEYPIR